jgi:restriction system protein
MTEVPDYQTVMLPLLKLMADGETRHIREMIERVADEFGLDEQQREALLPSGRQTIIRSRVGWARTYLSKAGLLERVSRGHYRITNRGSSVVAKNPHKIDNDFLTQFSEFNEFRTRSPRTTSVSQGSESRAGSTLEAQFTPQESIDQSYQELREQLAQDLLEEVKSSSPAFFEQLVVDLLVAMGYGGSRADAGHAVGRSGDGGIDGIIKEDKLGLDAIYVQAKRWENPVGRPVVQAFSGSLDGFRASKGVMITTSNFTKDALEFVRFIQKRIILIDGEELAQLMIDYGIGVSEVQTYTIYRVDSDYFIEE